MLILEGLSATASFHARSTDTMLQAVLLISSVDNSASSAPETSKARGVQLRPRPASHVQNSGAGGQ